MKLIERVFMLSLINAKYRRGMFWFILNSVLTIASLVVICYWSSVKDPLVLSIAGIIFMVEFFVLFFHFIGDIKFPWVMRRNEMKALNENKHANFEELLVCVPLMDYFD